MNCNDTIAAISTPHGTGGIAVIRLSGRSAFEIADKIFRGQKLPSRMRTYTLTNGRIVDPETAEEIDKVILSVMHEPKTYTGENTVEISCHGGIAPAKAVLEVCLKAGARMAERGEFTKRAFLNGKLDLPQAEAILDIVSAKTRTSLRGALYQLEGAFSKQIKQLRSAIVAAIADIEVSIDFSSEDLDFPDENKTKKKLQSAVKTIEELLEQGRRVSIIRDGISAAIVGKANVGKSSLLNTMLLEERAIVTPIPGTTRDIIEGWVNIEGVPLKLYDTCGFQPTENVVEAIGIQRTRETIENSSFLLFVVDGSNKINDEDRKIFDIVKKKPFILIVNKIDLKQGINIEDLTQGIECQICYISAKKNLGIKKLNKEILQLVDTHQLKTEDTSIIRIRQTSLLSTAKKYLLKAIDGIEKNRSSELITVDIKKASESLGEIIGEVRSEEVINKIFDEFCIGK